MKLKITLFAIFVFLFNFDEVKAQNQLWTQGTAYTLSKHRISVSLLKPTRFGLTRRTELQAHPLAIFAMPHIALKQAWTQKTIFKRKFLFSTYHGFYYPTLTMRVAKKRDNPRILPSTTDVPHILAFRNELRISHFLHPSTSCKRANNLLTYRLGIKNSFTFGESTPPIINEPIMFRETMVFYPKPVWYTGIDLDAHLNQTFNYFVDLEYHSINWKWEYWAVESKMGIMGYSGRRMSAMIGAKFSYGKLPAGNKFYAMPIMDLSWTFRLKRKKEKELGLFKKGIFEHDSWDLDNEIK